MQLRVRRFFEEMQKTGVFGWEICWPFGSKSTLLRWIINYFWNKWSDFWGGPMAIYPGHVLWDCFFRMVDWPTTPEWSCNPRSHISRFPLSGVARFQIWLWRAKCVKLHQKTVALLKILKKWPSLGVFWWSALYIYLRWIIFNPLQDAAEHVANLQTTASGSLKWSSPASLFL